MYVKPYRVAPGVYNVGANTWMASYLIDTGDGLVLIDTCMFETVYLILDNIRQLGYDPHDIKYIFLSHAHLDHLGGLAAIQHLCGAKVYMGERDYPFLRSLALMGFEPGGITPWMPFEPDGFFDDEKPMTIGNMTFETINAAGHTPGTTAFFWDVKDPVSGNTLRCGLHGGLGLFALHDDYFERTGLLSSLRDEFIEGIKKFDKMHVDICIPSHSNQTGAIEQIEQITDDFNPYLDSTVWHEMLNDRLNTLYKELEMRKNSDYKPQSPIKF
jgi:metallo-beta-lactamase class B